MSLPDEEWIEVEKQVKDIWYRLVQRLAEQQQYHAQDLTHELEQVKAQYLWRSDEVLTRLIDNPFEENLPDACIDPSVLQLVHGNVYPPVQMGHGQNVLPSDKEGSHHRQLAQSAVHAIAKDCGGIESRLRLLQLIRFRLSCDSPSKLHHAMSAEDAAKRIVIDVQTCEVNQLMRSLHAYFLVKSIEVTAEASQYGNFVLEDPRRTSAPASRGTKNPRRAESRRCRDLLHVTFTQHGLSMDKHLEEWILRVGKALCIISTTIGEPMLLFLAPHLVQTQPSPTSFSTFNSVTLQHFSSALSILAHEDDDLMNLSQASQQLWIAVLEPTRHRDTLESVSTAIATDTQPLESNLAELLRRC